MRRLFLHISMSVDGYIDDEPGGLEWMSIDLEFEQHIDQLLESIDGMIFGRVTYESLATFWPNAEAGVDASPTQVRRMHELPKYVLASGPSETAWHNSHVLAGDPGAAIAELKQQDGRDLALFAGSRAATSALEFGVVDELRLLVHPVLLGRGTRLFDRVYPRSELRLIDTRRFRSGALLINYALADR